MVKKLSAQEYFGLFAELMKRNPPHANDYPIVHRMAYIGIEPGKSFSLASANDFSAGHRADAGAGRQRHGSRHSGK